MSKFLELCEGFDPTNTEDPKWALIDFLKSKGINVSIIKNTDMIYIDTGVKTIAVTVSQGEEDSQESDIVRDTAKDPTNKNFNQAKSVVNQINTLTPKAIQSQKTKLNALQKELNRPKPIQ